MHTIKHLQRNAFKWQERNFDDAKAYQVLLVVCEEVGELCHAHVKEEQGIRGTAKENQKLGKDAVGDIMISLANYCSLRGWSMKKCVNTAWKDVRKRDWKKLRIK